MFERPDDESILCVLKLRKFHCFLVQISIISLIESFFGRTFVSVESYKTSVAVEEKLNKRCFLKPCACRA